MQEILQNHEFMLDHMAQATYAGITGNILEDMEVSSYGGIVAFLTYLCKMHTWVSYLHPNSKSGHKN